MKKTIIILYWRIGVDVLGFPLLVSHVVTWSISNYIPKPILKVYHHQNF